LSGFGFADAERNFTSIGSDWSYRHDRADDVVSHLCLGAVGNEESLSIPSPGLNAEDIVADGEIEQVSLTQSWPRVISRLRRS